MPTDRHPSVSFFTLGFFPSLCVAFVPQVPGQTIRRSPLVPARCLQCPPSGLSGPLQASSLRFLFFAFPCLRSPWFASIFLCSSASGAAAVRSSLSVGKSAGSATSLPRSNSICPAQSSKTPGSSQLTPLSSFLELTTTISCHTRKYPALKPLFSSIDAATPDMRS